VTGTEELEFLAQVLFGRTGMIGRGVVRNLVQSRGQASLGVIIYPLKKAADSKKVVKIIVVDFPPADVAALNIILLVGRLVVGLDQISTNVWTVMCVGSAMARGLPTAMVTLGGHHHAIYGKSQVVKDRQLATVMTVLVLLVVVVIKAKLHLAALLLQRHQWEYVVR